MTLPSSVTWACTRSISKVPATGTTRERSLRVSATGTQRTMRSSTLTTPRRSILCVPAATTPHIRLCGSSLGQRQVQAHDQHGLGLGPGGIRDAVEHDADALHEPVRIDDRVVAELLAVAQRHDLADVQPGSRSPVSLQPSGDVHLRADRPGVVEQAGREHLRRRPAGVEQPADVRVAVLVGGDVHRGGIRRRSAAERSRWPPAAPKRTVAPATARPPLRTATRTTSGSGCPAGATCPSPPSRSIVTSSVSGGARRRQSACSVQRPVAFAVVRSSSAIVARWWTGPSGGWGSGAPRSSTGHSIVPDSAVAP